jgi:CO/xanthine dehydrogenase Mo-binding subunit
MISTAPALLNAIHEVTGAPLPRPPATPNRVCTFITSRQLRGSP